MAGKVYDVRSLLKELSCDNVSSAELRYGIDKDGYFCLYVCPVGNDSKMYTVRKSEDVSIGAQRNCGYVDVPEGIVEYAKEIYDCLKEGFDLYGIDLELTCFNEK